MMLSARAERGAFASRILCGAATILIGVDRATASSDVVRLETTRDTQISAYPGEEVANLGGSAKLKTKGIQEFSLVDFDPVPLRGRVVRGATLHLHCRSKAIQRCVTVSSIASEWVEGTSRRYRSQPGASSFRWARHDDRPWSFPGSDITSVINGLGNTLWRFADASPPDRDGFQIVAVDPMVVVARAAGISCGFVIFDDVGNEYDRDENQFRYHPFPNRFLSRRESGRRTAPFWTILLGASDVQPPGPVGPVTAVADALPLDQTVASWLTPRDHGPAGTIGFHARHTGAISWCGRGLVRCLGT